MPIENIFCDEAGFTGNNLFDDQQPYFSYASINIDPARAGDLVAKVVADFRLGGGELKGQRLLGSNRGQKAIDFIISECVEVAIISVYHKRYTLASKFFEYIFEPVLAANNSIFYACGFHKFISNVIYLESLADNRRATQALQSFQAVMRSPGSESIDRIFPPQHDEEVSDVLKQIETWTVCHREEISSEFARFGVYDDPMYRYMLEVSDSSLWMLLASWGERLDGSPLRVFCDQSKPLYAMRSTFDRMIGRTDRGYTDFGDSGRQPLIFNLAESVNFVSSDEHAGVQLADVLSSATVWAFKNGQLERAQRLKRMLLPGIKLPVLPDLMWMDLTQRDCFVNSLVLQELVERTLRQDNLFFEMPRFIAAASEMYPRFLTEQADVE